MMSDDVPTDGASVSKPPASSKATQFERMAGERQPGFLSEFVGFIRQNKKWWLTPILVLLLLLVGLVIVSQTPLAPYIYPFL